jgi:hypothetical protein
MVLACLPGWAGGGSVGSLFSDPQVVDRLESACVCRLAAFCMQAADRV